MYHIELLPNSTSHITPGWTYVPDRGFDPAKAAITPAIGRKRGIRDPGGRGDLSSRENNAIIRHLAELDRENHRDVQIAVPVKQKEPAGRGILSWSIEIFAIPTDSGQEREGKQRRIRDVSFSRKRRSGIISMMKRRIYRRPRRRLLATRLRVLVSAAK